MQLVIGKQKPRFQCYLLGRVKIGRIDERDSPMSMPSDWLCWNPSKPGAAHLASCNWTLAMILGDYVGEIC